MTMIALLRTATHVGMVIVFFRADHQAETRDRDVNSGKSFPMQHYIQYDRNITRNGEIAKHIEKLIDNTKYICAKRQEIENNDMKASLFMAKTFPDKTNPSYNWRDASGYRFSCARFALFQFGDAQQTEDVCGVASVYGSFQLAPNNVFKKEMNMNHKLSHDEIMTICGFNQQIGYSSNHYFVIENNPAKMQMNGALLFRMYLAQIVEKVINLDEEQLTNVTKFITNYDPTIYLKEVVDPVLLSSGSGVQNNTILVTETPLFRPDDPCGRDEIAYLLSKVVTFCENLTFYSSLLILGKQIAATDSISGRTIPAKAIE